ncbi:MAG: hypothetical protein PHD51_03730 [Patescibacteria group bacterium]|nr:hypothetical protein [Patescibacteria group bacterium]MDD5490919.1 hypothetical protein [Patescibacteria group bacterium]
MTLNKFVKSLTSKLEIESYKILRALKNARTLRKFNLKRAKFFITEEPNEEDFVDTCKGKIPLKLIQAKVAAGKKTRKITVYKHKFCINNKEKEVVTVAPQKQAGKNTRPEIGEGQPFV